MSVSLDSTVGGTAANAYTDEAWATPFLGNQLFSAGWTAVTNSDKRKQALIEATRILDGFRYPGYRASSAQALQWPRTDAYNQDGDAMLSSSVIPDALKRACALLADWLLDKSAAGTNPQAPSALAQFTSITLPGLTLVPNNSGVDPSDLPAYVMREIAWLVSSPDTFVIERA